MLFKFASLVLLQICVALLFPSAAAGQRDESHIGINSNGFDRLDRVATPYWTAIHQLTGVQTLHELGYTGKGIVIAILDEDFEFDSTTTNPDASVYQTQASLCSGKENQVKEFLSFVTESKDAMQKPEEAGLPPPQPKVKHGSSVWSLCCCASRAVQGVAPEATVLLYKVRNGNRTSKEELEVNIKAAIKRAFVMGADVINISVGRSHPFPSRLSEVFAEAKRRGITVFVAAGNSGDNGIMEITNLAATAIPTVVGNLDPGFIPGFTFSVQVEGTDKKRQLSYVHGLPLEVDLIALPMTILSDPDSTNDSPAIFDICSNSTKASSQTEQGFTSVFNQVLQHESVVVVGFSGGNYTVCHHNLLALTKEFDGPKVILLAAPTTQIIDAAMQTFWTKVKTAHPTTTIIGFFSHYDEFKWLYQQDQIGKNIFASFPGLETAEPVAISNTRHDDIGQLAKLNPRSGTGPNSKLQLPPLILAPGTNILVQSGYYRNGMHALTVQSGTSLASPYAAGAAALVHEAIAANRLPAWEKEDILNRLLISTRPVALPINSDESNTNTLSSSRTYCRRSGAPLPANTLEPVWRQGSGLLYIPGVLASGLSVSPNWIFDLKYISNGSRSPAGLFKTFDLTNNGLFPLEISVSHIPAPSAFTTMVDFLLYSPAAEGEKNHVFNYFVPPRVYEECQFLVVSALQTTVTTKPARRIWIAPLSSVQVQIEFRLPHFREDIRANQVPFVGGFIHFKTSGSVEHDLGYHIPYFTAAVSPSEVRAFCNAPELRNTENAESIFLPGIGSAVRIPFTGLSYYGKQTNQAVTLRLGSLFGSEEVLISYVAPDWTENDWHYPPNPLWNPKYFGTAYMLPAVERLRQEWTTGTIFGFIEVPINGLIYAIDDESGKTTMRPGPTIVLVSHLGISGNRRKAEDWSHWMSPVVYLG